MYSAITIMSSQEMQWLLMEKYGGKKTDDFFADCRKLALGEPLAYLIGHVPFLNTTIYLDSRPLIPRPETEFWVSSVIEIIKTKQAGGLTTDTPVSILDLCAGSGCIGVAIAANVPQSHLTFSEIEQKHISTIAKNCQENKIDKNRCTIHHTSLFDGIDAKFDFIVSNPPYVDASLNRVDPSVRDFEPHLALFGGAGGLDVIADIIKTAPAHLTRGGQLWLEHEPEQAVAIAELATTNGFTITTHTDQYDIVRYSTLVL